MGANSFGPKNDSAISGVWKYTNGLATDTISEHTAATGVNVDGCLIKDAGITGNVAATTANIATVTTATISERSAAAGVNVDGVLLKDGVVQASTGFGTANANSATAVEFGDGTVFRTVITISNAAVNVANVNSYGLVTFPLYAFPQGAVHILGATANITVNSAAATNINQVGSGDFSIGTVAEADETMNGTAVDLVPKTAITDPMVAGVGSGKGFLATAATFDGTTTAKEAIFNFVYDLNDITAAAAQLVKVTGTAQIVWTNAGDH